MSLMRESRLLAGGEDVLEVLLLLVGQVAEHPLDEHLGESDDRVEGSSELVRHVGEELGLVTARRLELPALVLDLAEQAGVLDREGRLGGERAQQIDRLGRELAGTVPGHRDAADEPVVVGHRHGEDAPDAGGDQVVSHPALVGARHRDVGHLHGLAGDRGAPDRALALRDPNAPPGRRERAAGLGGGPVHELLGGLVVLEDDTPVEPGELDRAGRLSWSARVARSRVEPTARPTSPSAVSCSTDRVRSAVRASSSLNRRTFSIAMTAWSAKVCSSSICLSVNGPASPRRSWRAPIAAPSRMRGTATDARKPSSRAWCQVRGNSAATAAMSGTWTTRCSSTLRAVMVSRAIGRTRPRGEASGPWWRRAAVRRCPAARSGRRWRRSSGPRSPPPSPAPAGGRPASC